ncbi:glutathione S-transferase family protein [Phenylobacterium sp.]|uniref:glutathione S-transferase family protein n=1 Tax=Phenylobacterium sp. TaxID=1871053 RepID=UPI00301CFB8A
MPIVLYYAAGSCSLPALAGLEEAGADYAGVRLVLADGHQRRPEYLAVNPRGRIPTLEVDGVRITENVAVLTTIARLFPAARLLPFDDAVITGRAYELLAWFASGVHVSFAQVGRPERYTRDATAWPALGIGGRENMLAAYAELEARLGDGRTWLLGEAYSLADPYALVFHRWAERLEVATSDYPAFDAHAARVRARPAVARALALETSPRLLVEA